MAAKRNKRQQRRLRKQRRQTRRLLNPTPKQLGRERNVMVRQEYKPAIDAARADIRVSRANQAQLNRFYQNYRGATAESAEKSDANTQRLYQQSRDTAADLGKRYDDKINKLAAEDARSAALRGAQSDSSNQQRSVAGESQRQNLMNADSKLLSQLGASSSAYLRNVALASRQGQRLDNRRERNRRQDARNKIRDAKKERNQKINVLRAEQRQAERDWRIQNRTLAKDYGYQSALRDQSKKGLQGKRASARATRYQADKTLQGKKVTAGAMRAQGRGGGGGGVPLPSAISFARSSLRKNTDPKLWGSPKLLRKNKGRIIDDLRNRGVSPKVARRAYRTLLRRWTIKSTPNSSGAGRPGSNTG